MNSAAFDGRPVRASWRSARLMTCSPALSPSHRSGSGSHSGEWCPTHGRRVISLSVPVIRSASVRPARFVVETPSPT